MKKIIAAIVIFTLIFSAGCTAGQKSGATENEPSAKPADIENTAKALAMDIAQKNYENAADNYNYSNDMKKVVSPDFYKNDIGSLHEGYGQFVKAEEPSSSQQDGYTIISYPMFFENMKVMYNIVFDADGKIAGFNMRNPEPVSDEQADSAEIPITETALGYAKALMEERYDDAYQNHPHDAAMQESVNADIYKQMIETVKQKGGDFISFKEAFTFELSGYSAVDVPVKMSVESFNIEIYFDASNKIAGIKFVPYQENPEQMQIPDTITEIELAAEVNGYTLGGTLTMPKDGENLPCVVLVHGSGPNDRDETINMNKPFRDIAWGLASRGIAVYRYDKRSYSYNAEFQTGYDLTLADETIDDAAEISKILAEVQNINAGEIYILGHSLGGYAIPRIAAVTPDAKGYIIMAGSANPVYELIPKQYEYLFNLDGEISDDEQAALDKVYEDYENIQNIETFESTDIFMGMYKAYIEDMASYNAIDTASSITKPVLVLQGERDYQVTLSEYNMWHDEFNEKENWEFKLYDKLNHLMMAGEGPANNAEYSVQSHVDETLISDIADFILK